MIPVIRLCLSSIVPAVVAGTIAMSKTDETPPTGQATVWEGRPGHWFGFDGAFYSFANQDGQGIKLWIPPGENPVRGVILHGNPGGGFGGDTRDKTRQRDLQEFAARHHFGVAGVTGFPGRQIYEELGRIVLETFAEWGRHGRHPELETVPFIATGGSNAGMFAFGMMCVAPERTIAITPNCGPVYIGAVTDAVLQVPAWMHIGTVDPLIPRGVEATEELFAKYAPTGGGMGLGSRNQGPRKRQFRSHRSCLLGRGDPIAADAPLRCG